MTLAAPLADRLDARLTYLNPVGYEEGTQVTRGRPCSWPSDHSTPGVSA